MVGSPAIIGKLGLEKVGEGDGTGADRRKSCMSRKSLQEELG